MRFIIPIVLMFMLPALLCAQTPRLDADLVIHEFMAVNSTLTDLRPSPSFDIFAMVQGQKEYTDWIELRNRSNKSITLKGWSLTDDPDNLTKWSFPKGVTIPAGGFLIVFASNKDEGKYGYPFKDTLGFYHTNFELSRRGETLALVRPDGKTVEHEYRDYPEQRGLVSYGINGQNDQEVGYLRTPTPWGDNSSLYEGAVTGVEFDKPHGFYDQPMTVALFCETPGATIRYTLDGSTPTASAGHVYSSPIVISRTTCLRTAAFKPNWLPPSIQTRTYLFLDDVPGQGTRANSKNAETPAGFPDDWGVGGKQTSGDYQVDPDITDPDGKFGKDYAAGFKNDLIAIPSISLVAPVDDLFGENGIYVNQSQDGTERFGSAELLDPVGTETFAMNCGIQMQGGASDVAGGTTLNRWKSKKLSFRLVFRGHYGGRLNYPLFGAEAADQYNTIILDSRPQNSWVHSTKIQRTQGDYVRDQVSSDLQLALGSYACHGRPVHLYLNGLYWGLYWLHERPDAAFAASYLGGGKEDYDVIKHVYYNAIDGDNSDLLAMFALSATSPNHVRAFEKLEEKLDVPDFIDYMITNYYLGNGDWDHKNWYATHNRYDPNGRWRWHMWDGEHVMEDGGSSFFGRRDNTGYRKTDKAPTGLHWDWIRNDEYRLLFADRVHQHFFNDGPLTSENFLALFNHLTDQIDRAIVGESARWGDVRRSSTPYTRDKEWLNECNRLREDFISDRRDVVLDQFTGVRTNYPKNPRWYPLVDAPEFSVDGRALHGGYTSLNASLTIDAGSNSQIWYTLDGSDPRLRGGAVNTQQARRYQGAVVLTKSVVIKARVKSVQSGEWSALSQTVFAVTPVRDHLRVTELMYHPQTGGAEFIELKNVGEEILDLTGVRFTNGIRFDFPSERLAPGSVILIVEDRDAFSQRYPDAPKVVVGQYNGRLSNSGETLTLVDALGQVIQRLQYDDDWYPSTDGDGDSLVLVNPTGDIDLWMAPEGWEPSLTSGGTPGY